MKTFIISFIRRKNFKLFLIMFTIFFSFIIISLSLYDSIRITIDTKNNDLKNLQIIVNTTDSYNNFISKIKNIKQIKNVKFFSEQILGSILLDDKEDSLKINFCSNDLTLLEGKNLNENNIMEIILPKTLENYYEKYININYKDNVLKYYVIGIQDTDYACISYSNLNLFFDNQAINYIIIVEKQSDVKTTLEQLNSLNYKATVLEQVGQNESDLLNNIKNIIFVVIVIFVIIICILLNLIFNSIISDEKENISILKSIGYNNKKIMSIITLKILFLLLCSILLGLLIVLVIMQGAKYIVYFKDYIDLSLNYKIIIFTIISIILILFINVIIFYQKIKKISPNQIYMNNHF